MDDSKKEKRKIKATISTKPYLMRFWDATKNTLDPEITSVKSSETAYWKCPKCGYSWSTTVAGRNNSACREKCPVCETTKRRIVIAKGVNDFLTVYPELALDTSQEINPNVDLSKQGVGSHKRINWKCHICGYEWKAPIYGRIRRDHKPYKISKCPVCAQNKRVKSLVEDYPELNSLYSKNNPDPVTSLDGSSWVKTYLWTCDIHGDFEAATGSIIRSIKGGNTGCPYCHGNKVKPEESFGAKHPELIKEWSKNNEKTPYEYTEQSKQVVEWACSKGHTWTASITDRSRGSGLCPVCQPFGIKGIGFSERYPELKKHYSKDNETSFEDHMLSDPTIAIWECDKGHKFEWSFSSINHYGFKCPYCSNREALSGYNDFQTLYPEYAKFYDNERNEFNADQVLPNNSSHNKWWKCDKGHAFQRPVYMHIKYKGVCPVCSRRVVRTGINDALTAYPQLADVWDYEKNKKKLEETSDAIDKRCYFTCSKGHQYMATLKSVIDNNYTCPYCNDRATLQGYNDLATTDPELAKELSPNNDRPASDLRKSLAVSALWICPECHNEYTAAVRDREIGDRSCPYCYDKAVLPGYNDLATTDPELAKEVSPKNNKPATALRKDWNSIVRWRCPTCENDYAAIIRDREVGDNSCPYCNDRKTLPGYNDLATTDPKLAKEYSPNNDRPLSEMRKSLIVRALWICPDCGNEYSANICDREVGDNSCPYCNDRKVLPGYNDLATTNPELAKELSTNNDKSAVELRKTMAFPVLWICPDCGNEYSAVIRDREVGDDSCPYCNDRKTLPGYNDLATTDPELAKEYSPNNDRPASDLRKTMAITALWICPECGGEYSAATRDREVGDDSCPYCNDRKTLPGYNDLATTDPDLAKEISPNNDRPASDLRKTMTITALWICPECGGEYSAVIRDREVGDDSCPYCNGRKPLAGFNTIATRADLMKEWNAPANALCNNDPDTILPKRRQKVWWTCSECGRSYQMTAHDKALAAKRHLKSCPFCKGRRKVLPHYI